jgi:hypothetical protein
MRRVIGAEETGGANQAGGRAGGGAEKVAAGGQRRVPVKVVEKRYPVAGDLASCCPASGAPGPGVNNDDAGTSETAGSGRVEGRERHTGP